MTEEPFRLFQLQEANIRVRAIRERDFVFSVRSRNQADSESKQLHQGHHVINGLMIALNVGALGTFYWYNDPWVHPVLTMSDDLDGTNAREAALIVTRDTTYKELKPIEEMEVRNVALVFGIVAREDSNVLTGEYCRGLLLLRMNFYELDFRREAFMCFYRALEHFVAVRTLGIKRLKNELQDLRRGLTQLGTSKELVDELREVYSIRSSQVAHSQDPQRKITLDEVLKTKILLDFVMHKTFKKQANLILEARRNA